MIKSSVCEKVCGYRRLLICEETVSGLTFLMLRNMMVRGCFVTERVRLTWNDNRKWSENGSSVAEKLCGRRPVLQTKSKICPLE